MKYHIITYGCQMNESDSERIAAELNRIGHKPIKADSSAEALAKADLIVLNACSVRQAAIDRVFGKIQQLAGRKKIIVAGCLLEADRKKLAGQVEFWLPDKYFNCHPLRQGRFSAFVPIMTGCNNFCSYCVVPFTRGREKSRPAEEIINEIKSLIKKGYKEIILLGQNVNSYCDAQINFPSLLKTISDLPGKFWLSFLTSHPKDMSDELIATIAKCERITPYIHLPVQSGDNAILKKMNRHYTVARYRNLIKKIRAAFKKHRPSFPPLAVSTDLIVGFPGESKKQFENTVKLARQIGFDMIYFAKYSPRPGTAAARLKDDVPPQEKKFRAQKINDILKKTALAQNRKYLGETVEVLIDKIKKNNAFGHAAANKTVKLPAGKLQAGNLIKVKIISATSWGLEGKKRAA